MRQLNVRGSTPGMLKTRVMLAGGRVHVESAPSGQRDVGFLAPAFNHIRELLVSTGPVLNAANPLLAT